MLAEKTTPREVAVAERTEKATADFEGGRPRRKHAIHKAEHRLA